MRLILENFRCYTGTHEWNFDDTGITLLSGKSGSGKTSIIMAINFVLTNSKKNAKLISEGKSTMKVEMIYRNFRIVRTKRPERLVFYPSSEIQDTYLEDDEAQSRINSFFGSYFDSISYIPQQYEKSFLYQDPSEKLRLLEKLTFPTESMFAPDILKKKCSDEQKRLNEHILSLRSQILELQNSIKEEMIEPECITMPLVCEELCRSKLETLQKKEKEISSYNNLRQKQERLISDLDKCKRELSGIRSKMYKNMEKKDIYESISLLMELGKIENYLVGAPILWEKYTKEEANAFLEDYRKDIKLIEEYNSITAKLELVADDVLLIEKYSKEKKLLEKACEALLKCPNCEISLALENSKLFINTEQERLEVDSKRREIRIRELTNEIDRLVQNTKSVGYLEDKKKEIYDNVDVSEDINKLKEDLKWLSKYIDLNVLNETKIRDSELRKKEILGKLQIPEFEITEKKITYTIDELKAQVDMLNKEKYFIELEDNLRKEIKQVELDLGVFSDEQMIFDEIQSEKDYYTDLIYDWMQYKIYMLKKGGWDTYCAAKSRMEKLKKESEKYRTQLDSSIELKKLILLTESEMIEKSMEHISSLVNLYCSRIFDEPITIQLSTQKKTKTQEDKVQVNLSVYYRKITCDISYLSGGEQARLNLAFILAFAHVFGSPLLLLDECTSNLDQQLTDVVMDQIADIQIPKVILIAHQIVEGKFQQIINC